MNPVAPRLAPLLRRIAAARPPARHLAAPAAATAATTAAATAPDATISSVLASASSAYPLKDAVKFTRPAPQKPQIWTYRELHSHVAALAAGLRALHYAPADVLVVLLDPAAPEYAVTVLAAANLGAQVVALPLPAHPAAVHVEAVRDALLRYRPKAFVVGREFRPRAESEDDGIVAAVHPLVAALDPHVALHDARGLRGFVPLSGRPLASAAFPSLKHIIHTSDANLRGTISFKSLLLYDGSSAAPPHGDHALLMSADTGESVSSSAILSEAKEIGARLRLSGDHAAKSGKIVIRPSTGGTGTAAVVSAVMHETLWISPGNEDIAALSETENALHL